MEFHMQCLREKLDQLEKMLPQIEPIEPSQLKRSPNDLADENEEILDDIVICRTDDLANKDKVLHDKIYYSDCLNKQDDTYVKTNTLSEDEKMSINTSCTSANKDCIFIREERVNLLEDHGNNLCNNLQSLEQNQIELTEETQNVTPVLNKTQESCSDKQQEDQDSSPVKEEINRPMKSCNNLPAESDNCITCRSTQTECTMINNEDKKQKIKCVGTNDVPFNNLKCTCYETPSSTDSEESCECQRFQEEKLNNSNYCSYKDADSDSVLSNDSIDERTLCSEKSRYTCFCSRNESHEDFLLVSDEDARVKKGFTKDTSRKKFQGDFDTITDNTKLLNVEKNDKLQNDYPVSKNPMLDHLKLMKVEVREGLQRLKIRNRKLKNFLNTNEITSLCTTVSNCYSVDLDSQTRSDLVSAVKVLENKCQNKDAVIAALTRELQMNNGTKLHFKINESEIEKAKKSKSPKEVKGINKKFKIKDSLIGFIFFAVILVSHVKIAEMIFYLHLAKKNLMESFLRLFMFIKESKDYLPVLLWIYCKKFNENIISKWEALYAWLCMKLHNNYNTTITFLIENQNDVAFILSVIVSTVVIAQLRRIMENNCKFANSITSEKIFNLYKYVKTTTVRYLRIFCKRVLSSRIFWITLGYSAHIVWNMIKPDYKKLIDLFTLYYNETIQIIIQDNIQLQDIIEHSTDQAFEYPHYSCVFSTFSVKFMNFVELLYHVLKDVIV